MTRVPTALLSVAVALLLPGLLAINAVRIVASDWYVRFLYDHGGVPADRYGLGEEARRELALAGLRAVLPGEEEGLGLLRRARLPEGAPAFDRRELRHMADVRDLLGAAFDLQAVAGVVLAAAILLSLPFRRLRRAVARGLRLGSLATVAAAALVGAVAVLSWESFSTPFHGLLFEGESWRFADTDTLRRLYPDRFWIDTAVALGLLAVAQALALVALLSLGRLRPGAGALRTARQA